MSTLWPYKRSRHPDESWCSILLGIFRWIVDRFLKRNCFIRMHLHTRAIQRIRFDLDPDDLVVLQSLEDPVQYGSLGPSIHRIVDRVPATEALGQSAPLTAPFRHVKHRVEKIQIGQADVASLPRQAVFDFRELLSSDLYRPVVASFDRIANSLNTH